MFTKFRDNSSDPLFKAPYLSNFTQPNMAFTPRQIIEQFASGEVIAQENFPTDDFYDDKYSDDELVSLVQIDDDFQARQAVIDFQIEQQENETSASNQVRASAQESTNKPTSEVPTGNGGAGDMDTESASS